ncbi:hypothetical protein, partial [Cuneatibacter caecimuris]|uniref:hypothetical protein n=1 Tax=Cuneatibacter caecimuris TaxID=1796618 RepID=UPI001A90CE1F
PQKQNARRADKIRLCGHLRRYKKIVKKIYIITLNLRIIFKKPAQFCLTILSCRRTILVIVIIYEYVPHY